VDASLKGKGRMFNIAIGIENETKITNGSNEEDHIFKEMQQSIHAECRDFDTIL